MKNTAKLFGTIAIALALAIAMTGCDDGNNNTNGGDHTHAYGTAWKSNATQHWHECSCGDKSGTANHAWGNWEQTKAPTATEAGEDKRTCSICGKTETKAIDKLTACECPNGTYHDKDDPCCIGVNCECETVYGYLTAASNAGTEQIPILMTDGVTEEQMDTFIANIQAGYNALNNSNKNKLFEKIKEIRVVPPTGPEYAIEGDDGKYVITFCETLTSTDIQSVFMQWIAFGDIQ